MEDFGIEISILGSGNHGSERAFRGGGGDRDEFSGDGSRADRLALFVYLLIRPPWQCPGTVAGIGCKHCGRSGIVVFRFRSNESTALSIFGNFVFGELDGGIPGHRQHLHLLRPNPLINLARPLFPVPLISSPQELVNNRSSLSRPLRPSLRWQSRSPQPAVRAHCTRPLERWKAPPDCECRAIYRRHSDGSFPDRPGLPMAASIGFGGSRRTGSRAYRSFWWLGRLGGFVAEFRRGGLAGLLWKRVPMLRRLSAIVDRKSHTEEIRSSRA